MNNFLSIKNITPQGIDIKFKNIEINIDDYSSALCILKVIGKYPSGSAGANIGEYLRGLSVFLRELYQLEGLILDFSELDYEWGNNLYGVINPKIFILNIDYFNSWSGFYLVASNKNIAPLKSLFKDNDNIKGFYKNTELAINDFIDNQKNYLNI